MRLIPDSQKEVMFKVNKKFVILMIGIVTWGVLLNWLLQEVRICGVH